MPNNSAPFEIIAAPFTAWVAPVATAFPDVDEAPGGAWTKVGTSGARSMTEDGVNVSMPQTMEGFRSLGSTGKRKMFRTEEDCLIGFTIADLTLEQVQIALNGNTVTAAAAAAGTPGTKTIGLTRGLNVTQYALLVRGPSPYMADGAMQFEVPVCVQIGSPELAFTKGGDPAGVALQFEALESGSTESEYFGRLVAQTAEAET